MSWVGPIVSGVAIATLSSWMTVQISLRRFYKEKWWEKRYEAYSAVIGAASDLHRVMARMKAKIIDPKATSAFANPTANDIHEPLDRLMRTLAFGGLLFSKEMVDLLIQVGPKLDAAGTDLDQSMAVTSEITVKANDIARRDLGLPPYR